MNPTDILKERGIAGQAAKLGWVAKPDGYWHYPLFGLNGEIIGARAKKYPSTEGAKYLWPDGKPGNPAADWYTPPGTKEAIEAAGGVCFLANGEAALLAFHAAGIKNVVATTHSENTVPKNTEDTLKEFRIATLINIPDKDKAGLNAAVKWRDALLLSDTEYQAKQWPAYLPEKSDFNDLWIHVGFDATKAQAALNECQALILPQPVVKAPKTADLASGETPKSLIEAMASALRARGHKKQNKEWLNGLSVFREEDNASAGMSLKTGVYYDFGNGESYPPAELAKQLGIDTSQFKAEKPAKKPRKSPTKPQVSPSLHETVENFVTLADLDAKTEAPNEVPYLPAGYPAWIDQEELPASWVKAMNHLTHAKSMTVVITILLHRAFLKGRIDGRDFTISQLMEVLDLPRKSLQAAIDTLIAWNFFRILETNSKYKSKDAESGNNSDDSANSVGRPEIHYSIPKDTAAPRLNIAEFLEAALLERLCPDRIAPRLPSLRNSLDLDLEAYRQWHDRNDSPQHQHIKDTIQAWTHDVLFNDTFYRFEDKDLESPSALRGKLLRIKLAPYAEDVKACDKNGVPILDEQGKEIIIRPKGIQISRADLALELGTSESSMTKLYQQNNIGVKRMREWLTVLNPNGADIERELREAPNKLNATLGGVTVGFKMKVSSYGKDKWLDLVYTKNAKAAFANWDGRLIRMDIWVEQPSLLWPMNADEIEAKKAAKQPEIEALEAEAEDLAQGVEKASEKAEETAPKKERKERAVTGRDRIFRGHNPNFEQEQIAREIHKFTLYRMVGMSVLNDASEVIFSAKECKDFVPWLNVNASKTALRDESTYGILEVIKPAQAPAPKAEIAPAPAKTVTPVTRKPAPVESDWIWAEHEEEFAERMKAIGG